MNRLKSLSFNFSLYILKRFSKCNVYVTFWSIAAFNSLLQFYDVSGVNYNGKWAKNSAHKGYLQKQTQRIYTNSFL